MAIINVVLRGLRGHGYFLYLIAANGSDMFRTSKCLPDSLDRCSHCRWDWVGILLMLAVATTRCMLTSPQIRPSNLADLERLQSRQDRELAYNEHSIYPTTDARGTRYVKGTSDDTVSTDWKGLDLVLRSDAHAAAVLPERTLIASRVLALLALTSGLVAFAGVSASANSGINLSAKISGPAVLLVSGGIMTFGFGLGSGICLGKARHGYRQAVTVYNRSLARRLGL